MEVIIEMLIHNGRANTNNESFSLCHEDVLIALESIRERVLAVSEALSKKFVSNGYIQG